MAVLLFGAGFDSPASMVGLGTRLLLEHPRQAWMLAEDDELAPRAVAEILRYEPPVQLVVRTALGTGRAGRDPRLAPGRTTAWAPHAGRLQGEALFPRLLRRFPGLRLAGPPVYRSPGSTLRGLESLPLYLE